MKSIKKDDAEIFQIDDINIKLLEDQLVEVEDEINRRLQWVIDHKCEKIYSRFRKKWEAILIAEGAQTIPASKADFVTQITQRADYKNRVARDAAVEPEAK